MRDLFVPTFTGRRVPLENPHASDIDLRDIAHHLATINRFTGACRVPYSVAQHSIFVAQLMLPVSARLALLGLLHDGHEAYLNDQPRPVKTVLYGEGLNLPTDRDDLEEDFDRAIRARFGISEPSHDERRQVAHHDDIALVTEWGELMPKSVGACPVIAPTVFANIEPWPWQQAEEQFHLTFWSLMRATGINVPRDLAPVAP